MSAPAFSPTNAVRVTGTKQSGASVAIYVNSSTTASLLVPADSSTGWSGTMALANGRGLTLDSVETMNGADAPAIRSVIDVLGAPSIDGMPGSVTSGLVAGYAVPGATIVATASPSQSDSSLSPGGCRSTATEGGYWSCALDVASGTYVVQARQSHPEIGNGQFSSLSGSLDVVVDKEGPARPTITSPLPGSTVGQSDRTVVTGTVVTGTGESDGLADLYLDNVPVCQSAVANGTWKCTLGPVTVGAHTLIVIQRDAAGNYSSPSASISVTFGGAAATTPASPTSTAPATPGTPGASAPPPAASPSPTPTPVPGSPSPQPSQPGLTSPHTPPFGSQNNWGTPTLFGMNLPTLTGSVSGINWPLAAVLALAFVFLIALPLRVLATALRGRIRPLQLKLTGRNRDRSEREDHDREGDSTEANPWIAGAVPIATVAALIVLSGGVSGEVRYLRLSLAVVLGLAILNVVGVALAARFGARRTGVSGRLRFLPVLMFAAVAAAIVSRLSGIEPPVVTGVLIGMSFTVGIATRSRAVVSLVEIGAVTTLATTAWFIHSMTLGFTGFAGALLQETLATVALTGFGSAVVLVLPLATLPGRVVFEWSRPVWLATVAVVALLGAAVVLGGASFPVLGAIGISTGFAMVCVAIWAWLRYVEPTIFDSEV